MGAPYQSLPTRETKPKTIGSCMWNTLPNLTGSCARDAIQLGVFGLVRGPLTRCYQSTDLALDQYKIVLPGFTGRGVKYTHNDHINHTLLTDSGGPGLCRIPQGRHRPLAVVHDHTQGHTPYTESHGPRAGDAHHTTTSNDCDCPDTVCEASKFGKDFLRMAGIVQMLHRHRPPYDKYPYANPKRT